MDNPITVRLTLLLALVFAHTPDGSYVYGSELTEQSDGTSSATSWAQWPWTLQAGAGSTIPHAFIAQTSDADTQVLRLRNGAILTLSGMEVRAAAIDCTITPLVAGKKGLWIDRIELRPATHSQSFETPIPESSVSGSVTGSVTDSLAESANLPRVMLDSRRSSLPDWPLKGIWQPQLVTAQRTVIPSDQKNIQTQAKFDKAQETSETSPTVELTVTLHQLGEFAAVLDQGDTNTPWDLLGQADQLIIRLQAPMEEQTDRVVLGQLQMVDIVMQGDPAWLETQPHQAGNDDDGEAHPEAESETDTNQQRVRITSRQFTVSFDEYGQLANYRADSDAEIVVLPAQARDH